MFRGGEVQRAVEVVWVVDVTDLAGGDLDVVDFQEALGIGHVEGVVEDELRGLRAERAEVPIYVRGEQDRCEGIEGDGHDPGGPARGAGDGGRANGIGHVGDCSSRKAFICIV